MVSDFSDRPWQNLPIHMATRRPAQNTPIHMHLVASLKETIQEVDVDRRVVGWSAVCHVDHPCGWQITPWPASKVTERALEISPGRWGKGASKRRNLGCIGRRLCSPSTWTVRQSERQGFSRTSSDCSITATYLKRRGPSCS